MAASSIEKFIKNYINNKKISESKEGYEAWLRKNGVAPLSDFSESVAAASADYEKRASSYGSTAEHLAESGLTNSGYAKYLGDALKGKRNAAFESAISEYLETDSKNKVGYENELERLYNSGRFSRTLSYVLSKTNMQPFDLFIKMADFLLEKGEKGSIPLDKYTNLAFEFFSSLEGVDRAVLRDKMLLDRITTNNSDVIPEALKIKDENLSRAKKEFAKLYPPKKGEKRTVAILYTENKAVLVRYNINAKCKMQSAKLLTKPEIKS